MCYVVILLPLFRFNGRSPVGLLLLLPAYKAVCLGQIEITEPDRGTAPVSGKSLGGE